MPDHPRLAYICDLFPCLTQTFVYREVEELRRAGLPLTVFSMKPPDPTFMSEESRYLIDETIYLPRVTSAAVLLSQGAWLLRAPRRYLRTLAMVARGRYHFNNTFLTWLHGLVDFARGAHLARMLDRERGAHEGRPYIGHLHAQFADHACTTTLVASLLTGIPFSFRSHTSLNPQLITEKVRRARFVVAISRYDKELLAQWCGKLAAARIHVNYLGVPLDRCAPAGVHTCEVGVRGGESDGGPEMPDRSRPPRFAASPPAAPVPGDARPNTEHRTPNTEDPTPNTSSPPLILSVGTLCAKKGFEDLVRACRLLVDRGLQFRCLIVGSGPLRTRLEELIESAGLHDHVTLAPYKPQEEIRTLLRQADLFTLPCIYPMDGTIDGTPVVLMEAMAAGLPVVSTTVSGVPELVRHQQDGLLVQEKDYEALADALARLLRDPELAHRLGEAARETAVRRFDEAANVAELAQLLRAELPGPGVRER